ncbi:MAG: zinc ribbon domain-containing protein [Gemmatimonadota bacterium]
MTCPTCGNADASGNFCASCGTSLQARHCTSCGQAAQPGARFCASCGANLTTGEPPRAAPPRPAGYASPPVSSAPPPATGLSSATLGWAAAGLLLLGAILIVGLPRLTGGQAPPPVNAAAPFANGAAGTGAPPDLSTMTPREAADRLWDRVVRSAEAGDSVQARQFVPMGIAAYQRVGTLDADGLYHLSMLQRIGGDFEGARATAEQILAEDPNHLLGLAAAAEAAREEGEADAATRYYQQLLDVYDTELGRALPEYQAHTNAMPGLLEDARAATGSAR